MKKLLPLYEEDKTVYWPRGDGSIVGVIVMLSFWTVFVICSIVLMLLPSIEFKYKIFPLVATLIHIALIVFTLVTFKDRMYEKITFSHEGIEVSNDATEKRVFFEWSTMSRVQFHTNASYGYQSYKLWFKQECKVEGAPSKNRPYIVMLFAVDEAQLRRFVPKDLIEIAWGNTITSPQKK